MCSVVYGIRAVPNHLDWSYHGGDAVGISLGFPSESRKSVAPSSCGRHGHPLKLRVRRHQYHLFVQRVSFVGQTLSMGPVVSSRTWPAYGGLVGGVGCL